MTITNKIASLTAFLLAMLLVTTCVALAQLNNIHREFNAVANEDVALMESLSALHTGQLEKNVLLEKLIAIAEEMGFEHLSFARGEYLQDQLKILNEGFGHYAQSSNQTLQNAKRIAASSDKWQKVSGSLTGIETAQHRYDQLIGRMFDSIKGGGFQLSLDDLYKFKSQEDILSGDIKHLYAQMQEEVNASFAKSQQWRISAIRWLFFTFLVSAALSVGLAFWLTRRISRSLKGLSTAARQVGQGNFLVDLNITGHDEIAEVAQAFNTMSRQVQNFTGQLEDQNKDLKLVNNELDAFVHTVSHDIVAPLTGIVGYSAYLQSHYAPMTDDKSKEAIDGIRKSALRINTTLKDLLELTRITRVKNPYALTSVKEIVDAALASCEFKIRETKATIDVGSLPNIVCDRIKMTHIFINLISNALKYASQGQPQGQLPCVSIGHATVNGIHEFYVKDNGIGIDPLYHKDIFGLFKRVPGSARYDGSGAGLAIVKAAVESQGGQIYVESSLGQGATFVFTVPQNLKNDLP